MTAGVWTADAGLAQQLLSATRDGVAIMALDGRLIFWNAAAHTITGWSKNEAALRAIQAIPDGLSEVREGKWVDTRRFVFRAGDEDRLALLFADATTQVELTETKRKLADVGLVHPVTGLPGRALAIDHLTRALSLASRDDRAVGILSIGIGAPVAVGGNAIVADELVRQVVRRLAAGTRMSDFIAHTGPWEFLVVLTAMTGSGDSAIVVTARLLLTMALQFVAGGRERTVTTTIGVSHGPEGAVAAAELLDRARDARDRARDAGAAYLVWR